MFFFLSKKNIADRHNIFPLFSIRLIAYRGLILFALNMQTSILELWERRTGVQN